jgi:hypothetical protein
VNAVLVDGPFAGRTVRLGEAYDEILVWRRGQTLIGAGALAVVESLAGDAVYEHDADGRYVYVATMERDKARWRERVIPAVVVVALLGAAGTSDIAAMAGPS